jgi:hypothetical protein
MMALEIGASLVALVWLSLRYADRMHRRELGDDKLHDTRWDARWKLLSDERERLHKLMGRGTSLQDEWVRMRLEQVSAELLAMTKDGAA